MAEIRFFLEKESNIEFCDAYIFGITRKLQNLTTDAIQILSLMTTLFDVCVIFLDDVLSNFRASALISSISAIEWKMHFDKFATFRQRYANIQFAFSYYPEPIASS